MCVMRGKKNQQLFGELHNLRLPFRGLINLHKLLIHGLFRLMSIHLASLAEPDSHTKRVWLRETITWPPLWMNRFQPPPLPFRQISSVTSLAWTKQAIQGVVTCMSHVEAFASWINI